MRKEIAVLGGVLLALVLVAAVAVPAFAGEPGGAQAKQAGWKRVVVRLLLIQDEAKVDALIAKAEGSGKIGAEQGDRIKSFWTEHHRQFSRNVVLTRLIWARDSATVDAFLDRAAVSGRLKQEQADKLMGFWTKLHQD